MFQKLAKKLRGKTELCAVLLAGGCGSRMQTEQTKQFLHILGVPIVVRSLLALQRCDEVKSIVIVARLEELDEYPPLLRRYGIDKVTKIVPGGSTRQRSAMQGLRAAPRGTTHIAIHDAARCLITPQQIHAVALDAYLYGAAAAACPAKDTVKLTDAGGFVKSTTDRAKTWLVATPQIFRIEQYRAASYVAKEEGFEATDDAALLEHCSFPVKLTDCGYENIKITTKEDLAVAAALLKKREEGR